MEQASNTFARERTVIYLMTFIMGGCGIAYEYTLSKISTDLLGNSTMQWALTIALMMLFMGIGSEVQKHISDKNLFDKFVLFEILLGLIGGFGPILLLVFFGQFRDHYTLVQYGSTSAIGLLIGLEIPILTRINEAFSPELKVNIGSVLRMDYIGSFLGAVVWVFLLPIFFTLTQMSFVLGIFNLFTALLALIWFRRMAYHKILAFAGTTLGLALLVYGLMTAPRWTSHAEQALYHDHIIYSNTTRYQHIVLTRANSGDIFCYINGNTQFSSFDEHIYHEFLVHPAMLAARNRSRVLVLGGGDGLGLREILKYPDVEEVTLVDLDPAMTRMAATQPDVVELNRNSFANAKLKILENSALIEDDSSKGIFTPDRTRLFEKEFYHVADVSLVNLDASKFVEQIPGVYDVIIIDFPDPNNLELSKLYAKSFYEMVRAKLSRDGIMVQQSASPVHNREAFLCIGRTMQAAGLEVVPFHENVPTFGEWGWWMAVRDEDRDTPSPQEALAAIAEIPVPVRYLTPELIQASQVFGLNELKTDKQQINTIVNNVIFRYYENTSTQ